MSMTPEPPVWPYPEPLAELAAELAGGPAGGPAAAPAGGPRRTRWRWRLIAAAVVVVAAAGSFLAQGGGTPVLTATGTLTADQIAAKVDPGLVDVNSTLGYSGTGSSGTGIVLTSNGLVLTNNHVIAGATSVSVTDIGNGRRYQATVLGYSKTQDIALLKLAGAAGLSTAPLEDSSTVTVGQKVITLGNALGKGGTPSLETGQVTALGAAVTASDGGSGTTEHLTGLIAHNANIQPGDSGGPLVSLSGQVLGVDTAASTGQTQTGQTQTQAVAIPINTALAIVRQIESGESSATVHIGPTPFLGIQVASAQRAALDGVPAGSGALVGGVYPGTPAASAGLAAGDVITGLGGAAIGSPDALQAALQPHRPGDRVTISWTDPSGGSQPGSLVLGTGPAA